MRILGAEFVKSIFGPEGALEESIPEICFIGRSNVGKSSAINRLVARKIARTSSTPGATRSINIFKVSCEAKGERRSLIFSDFPGFGYSKVSKTISQGWQQMIEGYVCNNTQIRSLIWLFDIRREMDQLDKVLLDWLFENGFNFCLVLTKTDKETQSVLAKKKRLFDDYLHGRPVLLFSSKTGQGSVELLSYIASNVDL